MPKAYSYSRFSTPEQSKGDSYERQIKLARDYANLHGLELDETLQLHDAGISAHYGENVAEGKLKEFRKAVKEGTIEKGSYLLVESLDRISRQTVRKAQKALAGC